MKEANNLKSAVPSSSGYNVCKSLGSPGVYLFNGKQIASQVEVRNLRIPKLLLGAM